MGHKSCRGNRQENGIPQIDAALSGNAQACIQALKSMAEEIGLEIPHQAQQTAEASARKKMRDLIGPKQALQPQVHKTMKS